LSSIATFRNEAQFWTWLYRITLNIGLHRRRRTKSEESLENHDPQTSTDAQRPKSPAAERE
jgi:DNA-directed RNA polymerase specialized sigma24 family protein